MDPITLHSSIEILPGIGKVKAKEFENLGIKTLGDLLRHYPRTYQNRGDIRNVISELSPDPHAYELVVGTVPQTVTLKNRITLTKFRAYDDTGSCTVVYFNQPYIKNALHVGSEYRFWGRMTKKKTAYELASPEFEPIIEKQALQDIAAVYRLTNGIRNKFLKKTIASALELCTSQKVDFPDFLSNQTKQKKAFLSPLESYIHIHRPETFEMLSQARARLIYEELFLFSLGIRMQKNKNERREAPVISSQTLSDFIKQLPYTLTSAQKNCIHAIARDMESGKAMNRLLSGDVGCGKTVCAAAAAYLAIASGHQATMMAPTEILATQHYNGLQPLFKQLGFSCELLTGSTTPKKKKDILARLREGTIDFLIGTHALIQDTVLFRSLGLVITDEQHRFGVLQRAALENKCQNSHVLVMSATPIPRTIAMTVYGDLDLSFIDVMPEGRKTVDTFVVDESYRDRIHAFVKKQIANGNQVYIVCPAIESSDEDSEFFVKQNGEYKKAVHYAEELAHGVYSEYTVGLIHGKMAPKDKELVMKKFTENKIQILVSTTVIEVGVNVPNATLMIIENAERYGLAQLHQLRGRVGRGSDKSYCVLFSDTDNEVSKQRLEIIKNNYDGYKIAEQDLAMRGPGDYFSSNHSFRQHGELQFALADLCNDMNLLQEAMNDADLLLKDDPLLEKEEHRVLRKELSRVFGE